MKELPCLFRLTAGLQGLGLGTLGKFAFDGFGTGNWIAAGEQNSGFLFLGMISVATSILLVGIAAPRR